MYKKLLFVSGVISVFCFEAVSKNNCEDYIQDYYEIPPCISAGTKKATKFLYDWLYYSDVVGETIENELSILNDFRPHLNKGDYFYYKAKIYSSRNQKKSIALYKKADQKGNPNAGLALYKILHKKSKKAEAFKYLKSSAEKGDPSAQFVFGNYLMSGVKGYVEQEKSVGLKYLNDSAMAGNNQALLRLMDENILTLMDKDSQQFWTLIYSIYEKEESIYLEDMINEIDNWRGFCEKYLWYRPSPSVAPDVPNRKKYLALRRIVTSCIKHNGQSK